jgi:polysaccharide export outer membrane protein
VYLRPGDVVTVVRAPQSFTAIGATGRQAHVGFDAGGITLEEALGKAGGLLDERADPRGVFVLRYEPSALVSRLPNVRQYLLGGSSVPVVYQIDISNAESLFYARRFAMRDKDILYVSNAPLSEIEKVLRVLGTLTAPAVSAYTVSKIQ